MKLSFPDDYLVPRWFWLVLPGLNLLPARPGQAFGPSLANTTA